MMDAKCDRSPSGKCGKCQFVNTPLNCKEKTKDIHTQQPENIHGEQTGEGCCGERRSLVMATCFDVLLTKRSHAFSAFSHQTCKSKGESFLYSHFKKPRCPSKRVDPAPMSIVTQEGTFSCFFFDFPPGLRTAFKQVYFSPTCHFRAYLWYIVRLDQHSMTLYKHRLQRSQEPLTLQ